MEDYVWISKFVHHPVFVRHCHPVLRRLAEHSGVRITIAGPEDMDVEVFRRAVYEAIDRRVSGVMMVGWENPHVLAAANAVVEAGIPLILVDSHVPRNKGAAHVGTDWFRMGGAMGDHLAKLIGGRGKVLVMGLRGIACLEAGFRGFGLRMAFHPDIETLGPMDDRQFRHEEPEAVVSRCLQGHPDLRGIACFDGGSAVAAARALASAGRGREIKLVGVDADDPQAEYIRRGTIDVAFCQKREAFTYLAFQMVYGYGHGSPMAGGWGGPGSIPGNVDTGFVVVTAGNLDSFASDLSLDEAFERQRLSQQITLLSSMVENIEEAAVAADPGGRIVYANPATRRLSGRTGAALLGMGLEELFALGREKETQLRQRVVEGTSCTFETHLRRRGAEDVPVRLTISPLRSGDASGVVAIAVDITDRRQAEEANRRLAAAVDEAGEMIIITDTEGIIQYVNPAFERVTGHAGAEVVGRGAAELLAGQHDEEKLKRLWGTIRDGRTWKGRFACRRKDGTPFESDATVSPVHDAGGRIVNYVSVQRDVTQEQAMEAELRQAQKMEAIGRLAGGIAHDFNNLLTAILGNAELMNMEMPAGDRQAEAVGGIIKASHRAAELTTQLAAFARRGRARTVPVDLHQTVAEVVGLLSRSIDKQIRIELALEAEPATTTGDPTQLQNAVMNLALNARDAMPDGGVMAFATRVIEIHDAPPRGGYDIPPGRYVRLSVSDTGVGMDTPTQSHAFEPFFTTKEIGRGTGLGLASVYGCVRSHGGGIRLESEPARGTTFHVALPLVEAPASAPEPTPASAPVRGSGRILLVDDEETVRRFGCQALESLGYAVLSAVDGSEGLEIFRRQHDRIDLVILDLVMPGLRGQDVLKQLRQIDPGVRVLLTSGHAEAGGRLQAADVDALDFLPKPFDIAQLAAIVRKHTAGAAPESPLAAGD